MENYYEIVSTDKSGETVLDTAWSLEEAKRLADKFQNYYENVEVLEYRAVGAVYKAGEGDKPKASLPRTLRELFTPEIHEAFGDIDIYDDYDERCAIAWCGELLTEKGLEHFDEVLDLPIANIDLNENSFYGKHITVNCVGATEARALKDLMESMAGYCTEDEWEEWFKSE